MRSVILDRDARSRYRGYLVQVRFTVQHRRVRVLAHGLQHVGLG